MSGWVQDTAADSIRTALQSVFEGPEYQWERSRGLLWLVREWYSRILGWLAALEATHPVAYYVVLSALTAILIGILAHLAYVIWRAVRPQLAVTRSPGRTASRPRDAAWHLGKAARSADAGRFDEALGHRFMAMVLELDRRHVVSFHPSKTPAEYAEEMTLGEAPRRAFASMVAKLYGHLFGGVPCTAHDLSEFVTDAEALGARVATA